MNTKQDKHTLVASRVLITGVVILGLIILGRFFQLQILETDTYTPLSQKNSLRQEVVTPARGLIYDRNGKLLVDNEPIYSISITPVNYDEKNTPLLARLLDKPIEEVEQKIEEAVEYSWYRSSRLFTEIGFDKFSVIQENIWRLPGIEHQIESKRHYPIDSLKASHIIGYLREVSEREYKQSEVYHLGDRVGKSGLEMAYEEFLRGEQGIEYVKVNAMGKSLGPYQNGAMDETPQKGANIQTTIDTDLQILAEDLMQGKRGAVVAMDPNNGEILSLVSAPTYRIRRLSGRIDSEYWKTISTGQNNPLYNRAITSKQPPGSTFKPLMGLMALSMGIITPETEINNPGYYKRGRIYQDLADPGKYNLEKALQESSNTFFLWLMDKIVNTHSIDEWHKYAKSFGLGQRNGIDLPNETAGILPDSTYLNRVLGKGKWGIGDQLSLGIGQGFMAASPLQMALVAAQIGNGGYRIQPHLVRSIQTEDGSIMPTRPKKERIEWIKPQHLKVVKNGMRRVVSKGSGRYYANLDSIKVAGKTGTAQNPHGQDHGWFISFAPMNNPQIAVAVLVENAGYGSISAAPIASLLIEKYLSGEIKRTYVYNYVKNFEPRKEKEDESDEVDTAPSSETETATEIIEADE